MIVNSSAAVLHLLSLLGSALKLDLKNSSQIRIPRQRQGTPGECELLFFCGLLLREAACGVSCPGVAAQSELAAM